MSDPAEIFELYDAQEYRVIGRATRGECHGRPDLIHAVARVHVRDAQGRLLLQRRSRSKDIAPGLWDTSVGGHLLPGEEAEAEKEPDRAERGPLHGAVHLFLPSRESAPSSRSVRCSSTAMRENSLSSEAMTFQGATSVEVRSIMSPTALS